MKQGKQGNLVRNPVTFQNAFPFSQWPRCFSDGRWQTNKRMKRRSDSVGLVAGGAIRQVEVFVSEPHGEGGYRGQIWNHQEFPSENARKERKAKEIPFKSHPIE
jgi:hypothetical protein